MMRWATFAAVGAVLTLGATACSGADSDEDGASAPDSGLESPDAATGPDADDEQGGETPEPAVPSGVLLIEGRPRVELLAPPEDQAGEVPLFRWSPVEGAAIYDLVVLSPDYPIWAWQGAETEIRLGGLPFDRPEGMGGPVIVAGSCWSVVALDADEQLVAVSELVPVSPEASPGHSCVPGEGSTHEA